MLLARQRCAIAVKLSGQKIAAHGAIEKEQEQSCTTYEKLHAHSVDSCIHVFSVQVPQSIFEANVLSKL
jgi:hypothetical protein